MAQVQNIGLMITRDEEDVIAEVMESNKKYFDKILVLDGIDEMGGKPLADCHNPVSEHSMEKDIRFFHDSPASWIAVTPWEIMAKPCPPSSGYSRTHQGRYARD